MDILNRFKRISLVEKLLFTRNLGVMIGAGLPLGRALEILAVQTDSVKFRGILENVNKNVQAGKYFADALAEYPNTFNELFINMVRVGETAGNLEEVLKILGRQMKREHFLISRIKSALMYPTIIIIAMILVGSIMMVTIVPKLAETFKDLNVELPATTRAVIFFSETLASYWYLYIIIIAAFVYFIYFFTKKTTAGKHLMDYIALHIPYFKNIVKKFNGARFARTFSSLVESGVPIVTSLEITSRTLGNHYYAQSLMNAAREVEKGKPLNEPLSLDPNLYAHLAIEMVAVGEETGTLSKILHRLALFYEEEVDNITKGLSAIIEPILVIIIGVFVGFFAVSMIQPMYSIVEVM